MLVTLGPRLWAFYLKDAPIDMNMRIVRLIFSCGPCRDVFVMHKLVYQPLERATQKCSNGIKIISDAHKVHNVKRRPVHLCNWQLVPLRRLQQS